VHLALIAKRVEHAEQPIDERHHGDVELKAEYDIAQGATINVRLSDKTDAPVDGSFFLTLY